MTISFLLRPRAPAPARPVEVALVNLMPDAAFCEAEQQFGDLARAGAGTLPLNLSLYSVGLGQRPADLRGALSGYRELDVLYRDGPDAVIVTGTEPCRPELADEPIWDELCGLYRWAEETGTSVYSSCLASHAALFAIDGLRRRPLATKLSGVYAQSVDPRDPLTQWMTNCGCPHSRLNEVPVASLWRAGYRVPVASPEVGWTVAVRDGRSLSVLVQGHPEYGPTTLLREYRRDVRRFLSGSTDTYPPIPAGYLDVGAEQLLELFALAATLARDPDLMESFPFDACAERVRADWQRPMERLVGNWLHEVARRRPGERDLAP